MAASCTIVETTCGSVKKIQFTWVSHTDGTLGTAAAITTNEYSGEVILLKTDPSATAPTDDYDVLVSDADGDDVLAGGGVDRDTANVEYVQGTSLGAVAHSKLTLSLVGAGDTKEGVATIWIR